MNWPRLITQGISIALTALASGNLGRLANADGTPGELAIWAGIPALLAAAGGVGQAFLKSSATPDKPGCAGHKQVCDTLYQLALDGQWDRAQAVIEAWKKTTAEAKP